MLRFSNIRYSRFLPRNSSILNRQLPKAVCDSEMKAVEIVNQNGLSFQNSSDSLVLKYKVTNKSFEKSDFFSFVCFASGMFLFSLGNLD